MMTYKEFCEEEEERRRKEEEEEEDKYKNDLLEEISEWDIDKLKEEYINCKLSRVSYNHGLPIGTLWDFCSEKCKFCDLEYVGGKHNNCCDNCWEKYKDKTLEEMENG